MPLQKTESLVDKNSKVYRPDQNGRTEVTVDVEKMDSFKEIQFYKLKYRPLSQYVSLPRSFKLLSPLQLQTVT